MEEEKRGPVEENGLKEMRDESAHREHRHGHDGHHEHGHHHHEGHGENGEGAAHGSRVCPVDGGACRGRECTFGHACHKPQAQQGV